MARFGCQVEEERPGLKRLVAVNQTSPWHVEIDCG